MDTEYYNRLLELEAQVSELREEGLSLRKIGQHMGKPESTIRTQLKRLQEYHNNNEKSEPIKIEGRVEPKKMIESELPDSGVKTHIFTCAQNNTKLNGPFFRNLVAYAEALDAKLHIATISYNHSAYGAASVKKGTKQDTKDLWWHPDIEPYLSDERIKIANNLVWCGDWNIIASATDPVSGLDSYNGTMTNIFPHTKLRQKAIAGDSKHYVKRNITTGAITQLNYIQKKAGMKAEFDHVFSAIIVEVNPNGDWVHRQIMADKDGTFYDLDYIVTNGDVYDRDPNTPIFDCIIHGDLHAEQADARVFFTVEDFLELYSTDQQVAHDVLDSYSKNPHEKNNFFSTFKKHKEEKSSVEEELERTAQLVNNLSKYSDVFVAYSNHDDMLKRWLLDSTYDFRKDPLNAIFYLDLMKKSLEAIQNGEKFCVFGHAFMDKVDMAREEAYHETFQNAIEVASDENDSLKIHDIEVAKHGHAGANGSRGSLKQFAESGTKIVVGHYHKAEIDRGAWSVGTYHKLYPEYVKGYSCWTHTLCGIYPNGKRVLIDFKLIDGKYRWSLY